MTPGPTMIRTCAACGTMIAQHTIASGNTFGARYWTDGKIDAPMLPDQPRLVKCPHCATLLWIDEQELVGEIDPWGAGGRRFKKARPCDTPSAQDYLAVLARGVSDDEKERYLRLRAWWAGNDRRRQGDGALPLSDDEMANLDAFAAMLNDADEDERIMKAEALRELGRYDEAMALLIQPFREEWAQAVAVITNLTVQKVPFVREIEFN